MKNAQLQLAPRNGGGGRKFVCLRFGESDIFRDQIEVSPNPFPENPIAENPFYKPSVQILNLDFPIDDPEREIFRSEGNDVVVAGFVLFFPNYSTFWASLGSMWRTFS